MSFFKKFPVIDYDIRLSGDTQKIVDISRYVDVKDSLAPSETDYIKYDIIDGARPDVVSQLLYGTPDYCWTFFITNDHLKEGYRNWPLSATSLEKYISNKYDKYLILTYPYLENVYEWSKYPFSKFYSVYNMDNDQQRAYFKEYVHDTYQLVYEKQNVNDFTHLPFDTNIGEFINPYNIFTKEYEETQELRKQWNRDIYNYIRYVTTILWSSISPSFIPDAIEGSDEYYEAFATYIKDIKFVKGVQYQHAKYAPKYYTDLNGNEITGFEAWYGQNVPFDQLNYSSATKNYVTYEEWEKLENDKNSQIKVIRPDRIEEFSRRFKELINE